MARPGLTGHRKFRRLVRAIGAATAADMPAMLARGALELLWESCYESGDDYVGTAEDIEHLVGWAGEPGVLTSALADAGAPEGFGFLEPVDRDDTNRQRYRVHDLWHHAPDYVSNRRSREAERQKPKTCARCGATYYAADPRSKYCSGACRQGGWRDARVTDGDGTGRNIPLFHQDRNGTPAPTHTPAPAQTERVTAQGVVAVWNELVTAPIPKVQKLTADRASKIEARLKVYPDLETWRTVIRFINTQDWCRASGRGEHPSWTATLDWLCKSDGNIQKQLERAVTVTPRGPGQVVSAEELERRRNNSKYGVGK